MKWLSTIKQADGGTLALERTELDETGCAQPTGELEKPEADPVAHVRVRALDLPLLDGVPASRLADGVAAVEELSPTGRRSSCAGADMVPAKRIWNHSVARGMVRPQQRMRPLRRGEPVRSN